MIKNVEEIKRIIMKPTAITLCDIGNDWYQNRLEIEFVPDAVYPDYMQVQAWIMEHVDGKRLNIEQVVYMVYKYLLDTYQPKELHIKDIVLGNKTHFDVIVEK